jgi:hypothetical protein
MKSRSCWWAYSLRRALWPWKSLNTSSRLTWISIWIKPSSHQKKLRTSQSYIALSRSVFIQKFQTVVPWHGLSRVAGFFNSLYFNPFNRFLFQSFFRSQFISLLQSDVEDLIPLRPRTDVNHMIPYQNTSCHIIAGSKRRIRQLHRRTLNWKVIGQISETIVREGWLIDRWCWYRIYPVLVRNSVVTGCSKSSIRMLDSILHCRYGRRGGFCCWLEEIYFWTTCKKTSRCYASHFCGRFDFFCVWTASCTAMAITWIIRRLLCNELSSVAFPLSVALWFALDSMFHNSALNRLAWQSDSAKFRFE